MSADDDNIENALAHLDDAPIEHLFDRAGPAPIEEDQDAAPDIALIAAWADAHAYRVIFSDDETIAFKVAGIVFQVGVDIDDPDYRFVATSIQPMAESHVRTGEMLAATLVNTGGKAVKVIAPAEHWTASIERIDDTLAGFLAALPRSILQLLHARRDFLATCQRIATAG